MIGAAAFFCCSGEYLKAAVLLYLLQRNDVGGNRLQFLGDKARGHGKEGANFHQGPQGAQGPLKGWMMQLPGGSYSGKYSGKCIRAFG